MTTSLPGLSFRPEACDALAFRCALKSRRRAQQSRVPYNNRRLRGTSGGLSGRNADQHYTAGMITRASAAPELVIGVSVYRHQVRGEVSSSYHDFLGRFHQIPLCCIRRRPTAAEQHTGDRRNSTFAARRWSTGTKKAAPIHPRFLSGPRSRHYELRSPNLSRS